MLKLIWLVPVLPLVGVVINGIFGRWTRDRAHLLGVGTTGLSLLIALGIFLQTLGGRDAELGRLLVGRGGELPRHRRLPGGSPVGRDDAGGHVRGVPDPRLLRRLHARGSRLRPVLHLHEPLHDLHARPGPGEQLPADVPGLGGRGALLVPPDRVLVPEEVGVRCREEGLRGEPDRGRRVSAGAVPDLADLRFAALRRDLPDDSGGPGCAEPALAAGAECWSPG